MRFHLHVSPGLFVCILGLFLQSILAVWFRTRRSLAGFILAGTILGTALFLGGYALEYQRILAHVPGWITFVTQGLELAWFGCLVGLFLAALVWRSLPQVRPERRAFLQSAGAALVTAPFAGYALGYVNRDKFRVVETDLPIANLPKDLDGLRLLQITDIHLSKFLSERDFARAIDMANETRAHVGLITGDLISHRGDPLDACLRQLARLRCDAGLLGCLGNHEIYTGTQQYATSAGQRLGIDFLRRRARLLRFGNADINFAGVDYQRMHSRYLVGAEALAAPGALNILLSHNPDVFPVAASQGFQLTLAGHTHGGQINFELLDTNVNVARYFTPYTKGLYRERDSSVYVSSGIGTIGLPVRLGAPPEISVLRLCAI